MTELVPPAVVRGLWARRWLRRTMYLLVAGGTGMATVGWVLNRPFAGRWIVGKLDQVIRKETGLSFEAERIEVHPFLGRVVVHHPALGGDLLKAERLEVEASLASLVTSRPTLRGLRLIRPRVRVDAARLSQIHLRPRPETEEDPSWVLRHVEVREGWVRLEEPAWGVPTTEVWFSVNGQGPGPGRLELLLDLPRLTAGAGASLQVGQGRIPISISPEKFRLEPSEVTLGAARFAFQGEYLVKAKHLSAKASGRMNLGPMVDLIPATRSQGVEGLLRFHAEASGLPSNPQWKASVRGENVTSGVHALKAELLDVKVEGDPEGIQLRALSWRSDGGELTAEGRWRKGEGSHLQVKGRRAPLGALAVLTRTPFLSALRADIEAEGNLPGDPWKADLGQARVRARVAFLNGGEPAGTASVSLQAGDLKADRVLLNLPELFFEGGLSGQFKGKRLLGLEAEGHARTWAERVADVLHGWGIGETQELPQGPGEPPKRIRRPFNMAGAVTAQAKVRWSGPEGLVLEGKADVADPRWHGAVGDHLSTRVVIRDGQLFLDDIHLEKGEGRGYGELWLTFSRLQEGWDEIDMCYRGQGLPISEGLKAADLDLPIEGTGGGWVRIHGSYDHLRILAFGQVTNAKVYGLTIPAASGDMGFDLNEGRIVLEDIRVGESPSALGSVEDAPTGALAMAGNLTLDLNRETWNGAMQGRLDSAVLGLQGPRIQAQVEARLEGPWTQPLGPMELPLGQVTFSGGRVFFGAQSLEGLQGAFRHDLDRAQLTVGTVGKERPFLGADLWQTGDRMVGVVDLKVDSSTSDSANLAARLTRDILQDLRLDLNAGLVWDGRALAWSGKVDRLEGAFEGFDLVQQKPAFLHGDEREAYVDLHLVGRPRAEMGPEPTEAASVTLGGSLPLSSNGQLSLNVKGAADLGDLKTVLDRMLEVNPYSLLGELKPQGTAHFDLSVGGPYHLPTLNGTLGLREGRLQVRSLPQSIEDLEFTLRFQGQDILLPESEPLRGALAQGDLTAWGRAVWGLGGLTSYDVSTRLDGFELRDLPEGFELQGNLEATLKGSDRLGGVLRGTLIADRMRYQADLNLRELILSNALKGAGGLSALDPENPLNRVDLDLDLVLEQPWEFDTNLLKLQGRPVGTFKVLGTLAQPGLLGQMELVPGGRLTNLLPAGDVVLERGVVKFPDYRTMNPMLDLEGRVDVPPYLVNLQIRGNLDGLDMQPSSTPSLRRDEIVAILIDPTLATTVGMGTGSGATQSATSSGLARMGGGLVSSLALAEFQEGVRKTFKLDRVNVAWRSGSAGAYESTVTVGKNLPFGSRRIPLVVTHRRNADVATLSGQFELRLGNVVIQFGASQSGASGLNPSGEIRHTWSPR